MKDYEQLQQENTIYTFLLIDLQNRSIFLGKHWKKWGGGLLVHICNRKLLNVGSIYDWNATRKVVAKTDKHLAAFLKLSCQALCI